MTTDGPAAGMSNERTAQDGCSSWLMKQVLTCAAPSSDCRMQALLLCHPFCCLPPEVIS